MPHNVLFTVQMLFLSPSQQYQALNRLR